MNNDAAIFLMNAGCIKGELSAEIVRISDNDTKQKRKTNTVKK